MELLRAHNTGGHSSISNSLHTGRKDVFNAMLEGVRSVGIHDGELYQFSRTQDTAKLESALLHAQKSHDSKIETTHTTTTTAGPSASAVPREQPRDSGGRGGATAGLEFPSSLTKTVARK
jgi:hypothetical protein